MKLIKSLPKKLIKPLAEPWRVRALTVDDVRSLQQVQTECYGPAFLESAEVFKRRLASAHQCSLGVVDGEELVPGDSMLQAYLVAYWSQLGKVTPLDGDFLGNQGEAPILYVHDMSVRPTLAGRGVAQHLLMNAMADARKQGVQQAALVSVQGSQKYWARYGFELHPLVEPQQQKHLATYGEQACYMVAQL